MQPVPTQRAIDKLVQQGIELLQAGDLRAAREILSQAVVLDPRNEKAWLWRSGAVESDEERKICLQHVVAINPHNVVAQQGLKHLSQPPIPTAHANSKTRRVKRLSIQPPEPEHEPMPEQRVEAPVDPGKKSYSTEMLYWPESQQPKRPSWWAVLLVLIIVVVGLYTILRSMHVLDPISLPFAASAVLLLDAKRLT